MRHANSACTKRFGTVARTLCATATIFASLALSDTDARSDERCPPYDDGPGYGANVQVEIPKAKLDRSRSRNQLTGFSPHGRGVQVLGLTRAGYELSTTSNYAYYQVDGGNCFWVDNVDVVLRYQSMDVYVAKEYRPGSCACRAILAHEQQHVDIARSFVQRYRPCIRSALTSLRIPTARAPSFADSIDRAQARSNSLLQELLQPVYRQLERSMDVAQAEIDTPQAYRRVLRQCADW